MRREGGNAHRHERPLGRRQRPDRRQELIRSGAIDRAQQGLTALRERDEALAAILRLLAPLDQAALHEPVDEPARGRW